MGFFTRRKRTWIALAIILAVILLSGFFAALFQSDFFTVRVTDLRDATNTGTLATDAGVTVNGRVVSGILFVPREASEENPLPAVVLTHGYLNNRELQLQNAIELARRGFVVLTIDREGHGNYNNSGNTSALMATNGMYDSAKYLYNLPYVDQTRVGISGHSMGGYTVASVLAADMNTGIVSAGLLQGWSTFMGAAADVPVGNLKARDDEFFYTSTDISGNRTISREYLQSQAAATFVGVDTEGLSEINVENGGIYINGVLTEVAEGTAAPGAFRVVYESKEIHPLNHFSVESAGHVVNFFYTAFGTPKGFNTIASTNQLWPIKEFFSFVGLLGFFALLFPLVTLLLDVPLFERLRKRHVAVAEGQQLSTNAMHVPELKGVQKYLLYWIPPVLITLFAGFSIRWVRNGTPGWFPNTQLYPQDTTNWVALWAIIVILFATAIILLAWAINAIINRIRSKNNPDLPLRTSNPFATARIEGGLGSLVNTLFLAAIVVALMYLVLYINWWIWKTDFRIWTFDVKVFNVGVMLPTMLRYAMFFGIFYILNAILNQTYEVKNLSRWASIAINAFFNVFGIILVFIIQYSAFTSTGVMQWPDMNLSFIVLFPIVPILILATIISRLCYEKTGNIWLGAFINTLLFTIITVANTASSFTYVWG